MPSTPQISLDIRLNGSSDPGWVNVKTGNGTTYGYRYSGGDDGAAGSFRRSIRTATAATPRPSSSPRTTATRSPA